jgi:phage terminase large subunit
MAATQEQLFLSRIQHEPEWFMREILGCSFLTPQQLQLIESVRVHRRTAAPAGHGVGKTWLAARLALWLLYAFPQTKVITTAPTWFQVENLLWSELRAAYSSCLVPLGGQLNQTELKLSEDWFAIGLSTTEATRFQGIHAPRVAVIFDEATGVAPHIWEAAEGLAVNPHDRFLAIGNPTDPTSRFKTACDSGLWNVITLSCEEHPNVIEGREIVPGAVSRQWVEERIAEYGGYDTALARARIRGLWPEQGDDVLISLKLVEEAQARWREMKAIDERDRVIKQRIAAGCDVARFGSDETVIISIYEGGLVALPETRRWQNLMETAGQLVALSCMNLAVDDAGLGGGVTDRLRELNKPVIAVNNGESATDADRFVNRRAELWWTLREHLQRGDVHLPPDAKLAADLTNCKFTYDSRGRIKLEAKDEIKKRLGRSPDRGDALTLAVWAMTDHSRKILWNSW